MFENFVVPQELRPRDPRFGVGPSVVPVAHLENLAATGQRLMGTSHRKDAVRSVVREFQEGLKSYFALPDGYEVVIGNGGATFLWDMIGLGLVEESSSHFVCGEFSDKWHKAHQSIPWISTKVFKAENGEGIDPHDVADVDFVCTTLNETSTGVQLRALPKLKNPSALMSVDATSGAGQIPVDFNLVDVFYFSPQKIFAADGGIYVAILSPKAIERALRIGRDKSRYIPEVMKWSHAIENSRQNQTYNTPAIGTLFLMNEQMKLLNRAGYEVVQAEARRKAQLMYDWAEAKSYLSPFVRDPAYRSLAVATIDVSEEFKVEELTRVLRAQNVAIDIDAYRKLGRNQLRIALFHNVAYEDLEKLTRIIDLAIGST